MAPIGYDGNPDPPWGNEQGSAVPRGPPCPVCDEYMTAESYGWAPHTGETVDLAECYDCEMGWGPFTGYVDLRAEEGPDGGREQ
jgi:hypothetical protein